MSTIYPVIVGTAGHVDHGKSSLVRRLTGIDPDRWEEEKQRGLTIDLGFARFALPDGRIVGMIDVPGHERFLKNMVAGATSIDLALLVIAADDSVMPQTREHLDVLQLLGVKRGIVALTKIDIVDEDSRQIAEVEIEELLEGTSLEGSPVLRVSSITGDGFPELKAQIAATIASLEPRSTSGVFRMPVQRAFSVAGFGTVLTGIPLGGEIAVGDTLELVGKGVSSRIRGIQAYGSSVEKARAGHSTALNLPDIPVSAAERGDMIAIPGSLETVDRLEIELNTVQGGGPLRHGEPIHLHVGTSEVNARVFLLDQKDLPAGQTGMGQLVCEAKIACLPGDFALLRRLSPARTVAGGRVLGLGGRRLRRFKSEVIDRLEEKERSLPDPEKRLGVALREAGASGLSSEEAIRRLGCTSYEFQGIVRKVLASSSACRAAKSERLFALASVQREEGRILTVLDAWYGEHAMAANCPISELRNGSAGEDLLGVALERLAAAGKVEVLPGGLIQDPSRVDTVSPEERKKLDELQAWLEEAGARAHTRAELHARWGKDGAEWLERLLEEEGAHAVGPDFLWGGKTYKNAIQHVVEVCEANDGGLVIPQLRDRLGTSRKFLIPFLEHLDRTGVTARKGDRRILRRR